MDQSILIQKHIRDNADELQTFMRDLSNWEKDMKRKESQTSTETSQNLPPIRKKTKSNETAKKTEDPPVSSTAVESKPKKISAYDYRAWEKLDVDKICEDLDVESSEESKVDSTVSAKSVPKIPEKSEILGSKSSDVSTKTSKSLNRTIGAPLNKSKSPQGDSSRSDGKSRGKDSRTNWRSRPEYQNQSPIREHESYKDEFWRDKPEEQVRTRANYFKELGNDCVAEEKWNEAIKMYSNAVRLYPLDTVFYANRALCHLKLEEYKEAQNDCDVAIQINNKYVKAYLRRATALQNQRMYDLAILDFQTVLKHEPNNKFAKEGLKLVEKLKTSQNVQSTSQQHSSNKSCTVAKEKTQQFGGEESKTTIALKPEAKSIESPVIEAWTVEEDDVRVIKAPVTRPAHLQSTKPLKCVPIEEVQSEYKSPLKSDVSLLLKKLNLPSSSKNESSKISIKSLSQKNKKLESTNQTSSQAPATSQQNQEIISEPEKKVHPKIEMLDNISIPRVPITYVGFSRAWSGMKDEPIKRYLYLKKISGSKLPDVFGDSLENNVLSEILDVLVKEFIHRNESIYPYLLGLTHVRRIRALVLFLSEADKAALRKLVDYCSSKNECSESDITELQQKFEF